jgi:hypothetical protein
MTILVRDYQIRCNSLRLPGGTILAVDGMNGPNTQKQIAMAMGHFHVKNQKDIMDPSGIFRVHWHWAASTYNVTWDVVRHYNAVFDKDGNKHDGGSPPEQQAIYAPPRYGVSHTFRGNTHAVGLSVAAMAGAEVTNWGTGVVDQGKYPLTWAGIDGMLEETMDLCREFDIKPSPWTTITHCEVQTNIGISQRNKWDIRVLPDNPTKLLGEKEAGDILRARMLEKFS